MSNSVPKGFYLDAEGNLCKDRRKRQDRRSANAAESDGFERRGNLRRKADRERLEAEHAHWIEEALEDFAAHHGEDSD